MSRIIALTAPLFMGACAVMDEPTAALDQALISPNGSSANGISPSLISPNGVGASNHRLSGVRPEGVAADGTAIRIAGDGAPLTGVGVVGSTWTANVSDGSTVALRIDAADGPAGGLWRYRVSVSYAGTWRPLCVDASGAPQLADTVRGSWNLAEGVPGGGAYDAKSPEFTIACRGSAIAKCVELGYDPSTGHADDLAACVRALRGDYCGDGTPYTVDGTLVNIYDADGIVPDSVSWAPEAEWTPAGARCVSKKKAARFSQAAHQTPWCYPSTLKPISTCGEEFRGDTAIITELAPQ